MTDLLSCPICRNKANKVLCNQNFPLHLPPAEKQIINKDDYQELNIYKCNFCDYLFNESKDDNFYRRLYSNQKDYVVPKKHTHWKDIIAEKRYKSILDIGGGANSIYEMLGDDIKVTILDYKVNSRYKKISGLDYFQGDLDEFLSSKNLSHYDALFMSHVVEHIPRPVDYIKKLMSSQYTARADYLIEIPDISFYSKHIPYYTFFFEHCSLIRPQDIINIFANNDYSASFFSSKQKGAHMHIISPKDRIKESQITVPDISNNKLISDYKFNISEIINTFIHYTGISSAQPINLLRAGGGSANLFLYYLSSQNYNLIKYINPVDTFRAGEYIRSINKLINSEIDATLPSYVLNPGKDIGIEKVNSNA